jgi:ankyrin repeat protein
MNFKSFFLATAFILFSMVLSAQDQQQAELFWKAARANDVKTLKEFLDKGMDVNVKNRYGVTALSFASDKGNLAAVELLLEHGADPNLKDSFYGETPLGWAIYKKNAAIVKCMINHGGDLKNEDLVQGAAGAGLTEVVTLMLDKGAPGAEKVLYNAISSDDTTMFSIAFVHVKMNDTVLTEALVYATATKNEKMIARLKAAGARLPEKTSSPSSGSFDEALKGIYKSKEMNKAELDIAEGVLTASFDGSPPFRLKLTTDSTYLFADIPGLSLTVQRISGKITGITLIQPERTNSYFRVADQDMVNPK